MTLSIRILLCGVLVLLAPAAAAQDPASRLVAPCAAASSGPALGEQGTVAEAADYAEREAAAAELVAFEGGHGVFTGLLLAALIVVLVVLVV